MLDARGREIEDKVDAIPRNQMLNTAIEELLENVLRLIEVKPLTLLENEMTQENEEIRTESRDRRGEIIASRVSHLVPGIKVTVYLPFSGDPKLWELNPNMASSPKPYGIIRKSDDESGILEMAFFHSMDQPTQYLNERIERSLNVIRKFVSRQIVYLRPFNEKLPASIRQSIKARKERLAIHENLDEIIKIPLKHNPCAPNISPIQIQKRIVKPLSKPLSSTLPPEMGIAEQDYEYILSIIRHEGRTFEATPGTFVIHDEEDLRNIILAHLNGHFKGDASGETFRRSGKTDIRIEAQDRAAFVAECKVWNGPKTITESIDQLLGYLTWRDCKTAIIIFNKSVAGFTDILLKTKTSVESHPCFVKMVTETDQGEWRYIFKSKDDDARMLQIHVFLFNLYIVQQKKEGS
jgi:hypothetical protein